MLEKRKLSIFFKKVTLIDIFSVTKEILRSMYFIFFNIFRPFFNNIDLQSCFSEADINFKAFFFLVTHFLLPTPGPRSSELLQALSSILFCTALVTPSSANPSFSILKRLIRRILLFFYLPYVENAKRNGSFFFFLHFQLRRLMFEVTGFPNAGFSRSYSRYIKRAYNISLNDIRCNYIRNHTT